MHQNFSWSYNIIWPLPITLRVPSSCVVNIDIGEKILLQGFDGIDYAKLAEDICN